MVRTLMRLIIIYLWVSISAVSDGFCSYCGKPSKYFRNVILMIPDGCGIAHFTLARWYKQKPLACDALNVAMVRTYGSNSYITDSAPAATAFATGYKSHDKYIAVLPDRATMPDVRIPPEKENGPVATILEAARLSGRATGIVATSTVSHATPAAFTSHWHSRSNEQLIQKQMVYQNIDVVMGGGLKNMLTRAHGGTRTDDENLLDTIISRGYTIATTKDELERVPANCQKLWAQFNMDAMGRDWDRKLVFWKDEPSLAEMTQKAISVLSNSYKGRQKGFFLMVEGSQVDWASHANDPVGVISEYLAFDSAVAVAVEYAKSEGSTLLLVVSDHDNGGLSLGSNRTNTTYSSRHIDSLITPVLKSATVTAAGVERYLGINRSDPYAIVEAVGSMYGVTDLTDDEINAISTSTPGNMEYVLGPIMSNRTDISWTTNGHTGNDVPLFYCGTNEHFGTIENTDIARICEKAMRVDLETTHQTLFCKASDLFAGYSMVVDTSMLFNGSGCLTIENNGIIARLPFNKNAVIINDVVYQMDGINVYSYNNHTVYLPLQAKCFLKRGSKRHCPG